jgi:hypothetical protein
MVNMVIYRLACEHLAPAAPNQQQIACVFCDWEERATVGIVIKEWHVSCPKYDCRYGRWTGLSESLARQLASNHNKKHPGHKASHKAEVRKESVRVRDKMQRNGFFAQEAEAEEEAPAV